jgi:hypothetical protein
MPPVKKGNSDDPAFEVNCTKAKWEPKAISDIPKVVSRAFQKELTLKDIGPLIGTDHVKTWPMDKDSDIPVFLKEKSMLNEAFAEKVVRFTLPRGVMPAKWKPKKVKILAKGDKLAKYFGEDKCGERNVEISLKLFDCQHFYMKQTLPGSGISPHWTIFEGAWEQTERGLKLDYLIRYSWQESRRPEFDLTVEAVPEGWTSTLAWAGDSETQLNGNIPAVVGTEKFCWVEIYRDADSIDKTQARFNEEMDDAPSLKDGTWKEQLGPTRQKDSETIIQDKSEDKPRPQKRSVASSSATSDETRSSTMPSRAASDTHSDNSVGNSTSGSPAKSSGTDAKCSSTQASKSTDEESVWPLYIAVVLFVLILAYFAWQQIQEKMTQFSKWRSQREAGELW